MDGTLVDSMGYWENLGREYLALKGVSGNLDEVLERIVPMTMTESAALFIEEFGIAGTPESVAAEMNEMMDEHYRKDIPLKAGVMEYLEALRKQEVKMCVASATAEHLMAACLERLGVAHNFDFLLSCESVGAGKSRPDVYLRAAEMLGADVTKPAEIAVYEDAPYAVETARKAGFYVIGIYDESVGRHWNSVQSIAAEAFLSWDGNLADH